MDAQKGCAGRDLVEAWGWRRGQRRPLMRCQQGGNGYRWAMLMSTRRRIEAAPLPSPRLASPLLLFAVTQVETGDGLLVHWDVFALQCFGFLLAVRMNA